MRSLVRNAMLLAATMCGVGAAVRRLHSRHARPRPHRRHRAGHAAGGGLLHRRGRLQEGDVVRPVLRRQGHLHAGPARRRSERGDRGDHAGPLRHGSNIELFKYTSPDQKDATPKNSDIGGYPHRLLRRRRRSGEGLSREQGREDVHGSAPGRTRDRPAARPSSTSSRPGACSSRRSPIRTAWPTRRTPRRFCGARRTRRSRAGLIDLGGRARDRAVLQGCPGKAVG